MKTYTLQLKPSIFTIVFSISLGTLLFGCRPNDRKLITYDGGYVTTGDVKAYARGVSRGKKTGKLTEQQNMAVAREIALLRIAALQAKKDGLNKTPAYRTRAEFVKEQAQLAAYIGILRKAKHREPMFHMLALKVCYLKDPAGRRQSEAAGLLDRLNAIVADENKVDTLINQKAELPVYRVLSGRDFPICANCRVNRFRFISDALLKAPSGKFVAVFKKGDGHYLVQKIGDEKLNPDTMVPYIKKYLEIRNGLLEKNLAQIKNEKDRKKLSLELFTPRDKLRERAEKLKETAMDSEKNRDPLFDRTEELRRKHGFEMLTSINYHGDRGIRKADLKPNLPLFRFAGKTYLYSDLAEKFPVPPYDLRERLRYTGTFIQIETLKHDPEFAQAASSQMYANLLEGMQQRLLSEMYFSDAVMRFSSEKGIPAGQKLNKIKSELRAKYNLKELSGDA